jgi:ribosomal protein L37E
VSDDESKKWRCAWCGKPHAKNDPPCDECGHHKFEKAVVPVAPDNPDHEPEPVWGCPECGRQHQKNSPPCSRCGNPSLEKRSPEAFDAAELETSSYADLLSARYVAGYAVALVAGAVLVLGLLGVITLPGMGGDLTVSDVPGDAERSNGLELAAVEDAYVADLVERREAEGYAALSRNDRLDDAARFWNQRRVKADYGDGTVPDGERLSEAIGGACSGSVGPVAFSLDPGASAFESPEALASALVDAQLAEGQGHFEADRGRIGIDVHVAPDGVVYVSGFVC